jgi:hypothetical protein
MNILIVINVCGNTQRRLAQGVTLSDWFLGQYTTQAEFSSGFRWLLQADSSMPGK